MRRSWPLLCLWIPFASCGQTTQHLGGDQLAIGQECPSTQCGPALGIANSTCADGTTAGPTGKCLSHGDGTCGWEVRQCGGSDASVEGGGAESGGGCRASDCAGQGAPALACAVGTGHNICTRSGAGPCHWTLDCPGSDCDLKYCGPEFPTDTCVDGGAHVQCSQYADGCNWNVSCGPSRNDAGTIDGGAGLTWQVTCGDPVCRADAPEAGIAGVPACDTNQKEGAVCSSDGALCDPHIGCGVKLQCANHNVKPATCPISSISHKGDVHYLNPSEIQTLADEVTRIKLTTYQYNHTALDSDKHLGFVIEDNPESPAVYPNQKQVDLYGYTSMAVAALQAQERRIADLEREVNELRDQRPYQKRRVR